MVDYRWYPGVHLGGLQEMTQVFSVVDYWGDPMCSVWRITGESLGIPGSELQVVSGLVSVVD